MNVLLHVLMWILGKLGIIYRSKDDYPADLKNARREEFKRRIDKINRDE